LRHIVVTSVDRDDLKDCGAHHWAACIRALKQGLPGATVEVLTPDFKGKPGLLDVVLDAGPHVFSHNTETVERLYHSVRPQSYFVTTVNVLRQAHGFGGKLKSGLMVGLGETDGEVLRTLDLWADIGLDIATLGQYLRPTMKHLPVDRYVPDTSFALFKEHGETRGIPVVFSGPLVRSSYHAGETFLELGTRPVRSNPLAVLR